MGSRAPADREDTRPLGSNSTGPVPVAIVVPVLNEAGSIASCLERLRRDFADCELLVVDGGSSDATVSLAEPFARILGSVPGRAAQMNAGAAATTASVLWFVHADCVIDPRALGQLQAALRDPQVVGGGLSLRFDRRSLGLDYLAWASTKRARHLHEVFGDQAMFVRRDVFEALGGFPELAIMEDLELSRRLARRGRLAVLPATSTASSRRFDEHGTWSMIAFMQALKAGYFLGVDAGRLGRLYRAGPPWQRTGRRRTRTAEAAAETTSREPSRAAGVEQLPESTTPRAEVSLRVPTWANTIGPSAPQHGPAHAPSATER